MREYSPKINELESKEDCSLLFKHFFFFFGDNGNFIDIKKKKIKFPKYIESIQLGTIQSATQVT